MIFKLGYLGLDGGEWVREYRECMLDSGGLWLGFYGVGCGCRHVFLGGGLKAWGRW